MSSATGPEICRVHASPLARQHGITDSSTDEALTKRYNTPHEQGKSINHMGFGVQVISRTY